MKHRSTRELYDYWQRLRGSRPAPDRTEIEPSDIRRILGDTFILEAASRHDYRFRLAGTRVCALYGRELKGRDFLDLWTGEDRETMATMLAAITQDAAAAVIGTTGRSAHERSLPCEVLLLPIRQKGGGWTRILGSFLPMDDPYWIGIHPIMAQSIVSLRLIWPDERPHFLRRGDEIDDDIEAVPVSPYGARPTDGGAFAGGGNGAITRRVGHLLVFEGGKSS
ncbi:PAS domain-containing protein [Siculibacillus lacustris]|uniref:PAS domain-containing protein n=1 Tax=Siculibacillus lacustris TaxID=1549641 RepID=A0A4Q9VEH6_9HYPH|nr:PAS domain-containing protein [Siculibacillus lacustris]TBW33088.1 PAS domain-containing protein [Siculibacillus lacustris]